MPTQPHPLPEGFPPVRRRVNLSGKLLLEGGEEQSCVLEAVQGHHAHIVVSEPGPVDARGRAVVYLELVGRIQGLACRTGPRQVVVAVSAPAAKWRRLQQQFAMLAQMPAPDRECLRAHRRIALDDADVVVALPDHRTRPGVIRDVSRSGAGVLSDAAVCVGDRVTLGATRGQVVRVDDRGFAVQFTRLLPLERFGTAFRL